MLLSLNGIMGTHKTVYVAVSYLNFRISTYASVLVEDSVLCVFIVSNLITAMCIISKTSEAYYIAL